MQLNYLGRYRSLYQFLTLVDTEAKCKQNIILGRLTDQWGATVPSFDPSKSFFYNASSVKDGVTAGTKCSTITVTKYLVSKYAPSVTVTGATIIQYNGTTYYAIPVTKANAMVTDTQGRPFLNLYVQFVFKVAAAGSEFTFRQIGFHDPSSDISDDGGEVFCYENVNPQTVNAGDGLTLRLVLAF